MTSILAPVTRCIGVGAARGLPAVRCENQPDGAKLCQACNAEIELRQRLIVSSSRAIALEERMRAAGLPDPLIRGERGFDGFRIETPGHAQALEAVKSWAAGTGPNVRLVGNLGNGKTRLLEAAIAAVCAREKSARYESAYRWRNQIRGSFREDGESERVLVERLTSVHYLALDDLFATKTTTVVLDAICAVLDERADRNKPTLIAINNGLEELPARLAAAGGDEYDVYRVIDRLVGLCPVEVELRGVSLRGEVVEVSR